MEVDDALGYEAAGCFKNIAVAAEDAYEIVYDFRITDFQRHDDQTASLTVSVSNAQDIASFYIGTKLTLYAIHADHSRTALATWSCMENDLNSYAFAASEENASGGVIVTAPTCGSAGVTSQCRSHRHLR